MTRTIYLADLPYQIGLNPFYPNAILCRHISPHPMYNEAQEIKEMTFLMKFIIENKLLIQHSGWLFVGACLLFEKKPVQEMGNEFIINAIVNGQNADDLMYLRDYIADMIITYTTPINRLFAFLDRTDNPPAVIAFKYQIIERCLDKIDPTKPPKGYKKLLAYQQEFAQKLRFFEDQNKRVIK